MSKLSLSVLRLPNFRRLLAARMSVTMAMQAQAVIVGWQVYSITKSPFMLGLAGLAEALPALLAGIVAGHVVDAVGRPAVIYRFCVGMMLLNTFTFLLLAGDMVPAPGGSLLPWIFGGVAMSGVLRSLTAPASFSILSLVVTRAELPAGAAWISSGWQMAAVTGPAVAGLLYGGYGARGAWLLPTLLLIFAFVTVVFLRPKPHPRGEHRVESAVKSIHAGWKFIVGHPMMLSMMALDMFAVLFGGAVSMLPAYADQILHVGAEGLGALRAGPALGGIVTGLYLALQPMKKLSAKRMMWAVAGFGVCMIGFGLSTSFYLSLALLVLSGIFDNVSAVMRSVLMQILTPDDMRGRVSSINTMFVISSNEIGAFESGTAARLLGLVPSVVAGGVMTLLVVAFIATASPRFRKMVVDG